MHIWRNILSLVHHENGFGSPVEALNRYYAREARLDELDKG